MTGLPQAPASTWGMPKPSSRDGRRVDVAGGHQVGHEVPGDLVGREAHPVGIPRFRASSRSRAFWTSVRGWGQTLQTYRQSGTSSRTSGQGLHDLPAALGGGVAAHGEDQQLVRADPQGFAHGPHLGVVRGPGG